MLMGKDKILPTFYRTETAAIWGYQTPKPDGEDHHLISLKFNLDCETQSSEGKIITEGKIKCTKHVYCKSAHVCDKKNSFNVLMKKIIIGRWAVCWLILLNISSDVCINKVFYVLHNIMVAQS